MVRGSDRAGNRRLLLVVRETLSSKVRGAALRNLDDDRRLDVAGASGVRQRRLGRKGGAPRSLKNGVRDGRGGDVLKA
jgi:hypothetical protein